jgi:hypothetical protein
MNMSEDQKSIRYTGQALVPWTPDEIAQEFEKCHLGSNPVMFRDAFTVGVKSREKPDVPKPFNTCWGAWFPTDVLGNPMREVSPGRWENSSWESEKKVSSSLILRITTAYEQGVGQANRTELKNPYPATSPECEAWDLGREHILSQDKNASMRFGYGGETTQYKVNKQPTK